MRSTEMPAWKKTEDCTENSFQMRDSQELIFEGLDVEVQNLNLPFDRTGCVIMASGLGKRFGSNKLLTDINGKPMIEWILDATDGVFSSRVVVTRHKEVLDLCISRNIKAILHEFSGRNDTIRLGLEAIKSGIDRCMFCPSDQPLLSRNTIIALVYHSLMKQNIIWRPSYQDIVGAPVLFPSWTFQELCSLPEGKGGGVLLRKYPDRIKNVEISNGYELQDIDTQENLKELINTLDLSLHGEGKRFILPEGKGI